MNLPAVKQLKEQAFHSFKRFPLALIAAAAATAVAIVLVETNPAEPFVYLRNTIIVAILGIPLFTAIPLIAERKAWNPRLQIAGYIAGIALLTVFYFLLPEQYDFALSPLLFSPPYFNFH